MNNPKEIWREIRRRFDPFEPVQKPEWRARRQNTNIRDISYLLASDPDTAYHLLVMGPAGSGKTTELLGIAAERNAQEDCVVFLDVHRHFDLVLGDKPSFQRVSAWEVLILLGLTLIRKGIDEGIPQEDLQETAKTLAINWEKLGKASGVTPLSVNVSSIFEAAQLITPALMSAANASPTLSTALNAASAAAAAIARGIHWTWIMGAAKIPILDQESEAQDLIHTIGLLIQIIRSHTRSRRMVLIIDGLDRIQDIDHAKALMVDSSLFTYIKNATLIVTAPHALYQRQPTVLQSRYRYSYALYNEMVLDKYEPWKDGPGIETLLELYHKRIADLNAPNFIHEAWLRYIAYYSGGHTRHFVRLIRTLADFAYGSDPNAPIEIPLDRAFRQIRLPLEAGMDKGDIEILEGVIRDPHHALPIHEKTSALLWDDRLLPYVNDAEWYFPHTMLTMFRLEVPHKRPKPILLK